jgi:hypothetical protein
MYGNYDGWNRGVNASEGQKKLGYFRDLKEDIMPDAVVLGLIIFVPVVLLIGYYIFKSL